ncbi:MAG: hypothetical protein Ta2G_08280 [Termitinemataceae bacterium]|nr:MAG: hypothetical protein Ta2G_08280 [Termitinemataceae bacterium]
MKDSLFEDETASSAKPAKGKKKGQGNKKQGEELTNALATVLAKAIDDFLAVKNDAASSRVFIEDIYKKILQVDSDDPVWKLLGFLENKSDYYTAPASTHYHGSYAGGLVIHSLSVLSWCIKLSAVMLKKTPNYYALTTACLFHDLCKVNMYEEKTRNVKDEKTGRWESVPCYKVKENYLAMGHGIESVLRLNEFLKLPQPWLYAVRFHMGAYGDDDMLSLGKATRSFAEVLLLHTADMMAGIVNNV